jgi:hypothetical protein
MKTIVIIYSIAAQMQHVYMPSQKKIRHAVKEREVADCTAPSPSQSRCHSGKNVYIAYIQVPVQALFTLCFKLSQALRIFILF